MFKMTVFLFLIAVTHGNPAPTEPMGSLKSNETFASEEECNSYFSTVRGKASKAIVENVVKEMKLRAVYKCEAIPGAETF